MAAKLRDVKLDDKPVLCRILPAGHYGSAGQQGMREIAEKYAWILHIIYPEYQSPNTQAVSSETRHGP
jgi:protease II